MAFLEAFYVFFIGLCFGSFANVVIYRLPAKESFFMSRSRCPKCKKQIAWYDNIPVFAWLLLRAKCRKCKAPISWRYPLVELLVGLFTLAAFLKFGWSWLFLEMALFFFFLVICSFIDFDHMILPDVFTLSGIVIGFVLAFVMPNRTVMESFLGILLGGGGLWAVAYIYYILRKQDGMGGGDIKLLAWVGAVLGWKAIPFVIFSASIVGSIVGLIIMSKKTKKLETVIPFGPYIAAGAIAYALVGQEIAAWYFGLLLPGL